MDKENLELLKQKIIKLRKDLFVNATKNLIVFSFFSVITPSISKLAGFGYPFIIDKKKGYKLSINMVDNLGHKNNKYKDISQDEINEYKEFVNKLYIYSDYEYNDSYKRNVVVYEIDLKEQNYNEIINNYQDYMIESNKVDSYEEELDNSYVYNFEAIDAEFEYCDIKRNRENDEPENIFINIFVTLGYVILVSTELYVCGNSFYNHLLDYNSQVNYLKKRIKKIK